MGEVRYFNGEIALNERGQNDQLVEFLEKSLERAKNGEIVGMSGAIQYADNSAGSFAMGFLRNQIIIGSMMTSIINMTVGD